MKACTGLPSHPSPCNARLAPRHCCNPGQVVPAESKHTLLGSKVEIRLKKADGQHWATLEKSGAKAAPNYSNPELQKPPSYPSSFTARKPMNWDKLEAELKGGPQGLMPPDRAHG